MTRGFHRSTCLLAQSFNILWWTRFRKLSIVSWCMFIWGGRCSPPKRRSQMTHTDCTPRSRVSHNQKAKIHISLKIAAPSAISYKRASATWISLLCHIGLWWKSASVAWKERSAACKATHEYDTQALAFGRAYPPVIAPLWAFGGRINTGINLISMYTLRAVLFSVIFTFHESPAYLKMHWIKF